MVADSAGSSQREKWLIRFELLLPIKPPGLYSAVDQRNEPIQK